MTRRYLIPMVGLLLGSLSLPAIATEYSFPTEMKVTIERGDEPVYTEGSNLVYPVVSYFSFKPAFDETETSFVLFKNGGDTLTAISMGDRFQIEDSISRDDEVSFAKDPDTAPRPIRVLLTDPIPVGHVHFSVGSARLSDEAKAALDAIAAEMKNSGLFGALLVGRTDRGGSETANLSLGSKRASAVKRYLGKSLSNLGISDFALTRESLGEYLADASNGATSLKDRKVSILIYSHS